MLKALTRPITDYQTAQAGKRAAATNMYDPHAYTITKLPPVEVWDPQSNPEHKEIQLLLETETEETTAVQATELQQVQRGSPLFTQCLFGICLFGICLGTELLSGIGIAHELGAQGANALLLGGLLGSTIFFLVMELHR